MLRLLDPERIETLKAQVVVPNALGPVIAPSLAGDDARAAVLSAPRLTARTHLSGWKDWSVLSGHGATAASERPVAHLHFVLTRPWRAGARRSCPGPWRPRRSRTGGCWRPSAFTPTAGRWPPFPAQASLLAHGAPSSAG